MDIRPIRTEEDYEAACRRIDEIFQAEPGSAEDDELEILATLVDAYEEKHFPIGKPHPIEAIKISMENLGLTRKDLMEHLGKSSGRVSDMLNCRRALTLGDIRELNRLLHLPMEVLSQDYPLEEAKPKETLKATGSAATL
jgi:HTH-type transcriptional regulator/antitoxin HigA